MLDNTKSKLVIQRFLVIAMHLEIIFPYFQTDFNINYSDFHFKCGGQYMFLFLNALKNNPIDN